MIIVNISTPIKAIIWDMGGVLLRTENLQPRINLAKKLGVSYSFLNELVFSSPTSFQAEAGLIPKSAHWQIVADTLKLPDVEIDDFFTEWFSGDRCDVALVGYIKQLRLNFKTALLSNVWDGMRGIIERNYGFLDAFDQVVFSYEVNLVKPDPRIFLLMLERLGVIASEAVFIDDFEKNILGARSVGICSFLFENSEQIRTDIEKKLGCIG